MNVARIASIVTAIGVLLVAVGKLFTGEAPNWTEITLAITTLTAAFGFQRKPV